MKKQLIVKKLLVKASDVHGYGVFADQDIDAGEIIEECYAIPIKTRTPELTNYYFGDDKRTLLLLGNGLIYNHSSQPNAENVYDIENKLMIFKAAKPIKKGEEITIFYNQDWFRARQFKEIKPSKRYQIKRFFKKTAFIFRFIIVTILFLALIALIKTLLSSPTKGF